MHEIPAVPAVADAPASLFDGGHLWIQECVDGAVLRVQLRDSGLLEFGTRSTTFDGDVPLEHRHAVRHVRASFNRESLRAALDDVTTVTLFGVTTHGRGVAYDRDSLPPFLVVDAWSEVDGGLLPPDAVEALAKNLGLTALPAVQKEVRAADFDVGGYDFPTSTWRDGPAGSVLVRNKTGDRARYTNPGVNDSPRTATKSPGALAAELVTSARIERACDSLDTTDPDSDAVTERVVELVAHEAIGTLLGDQTAVELDAFRSEAGTVVRNSLYDDQG